MSSEPLPDINEKHSDPLSELRNERDTAIAMLENTWKHLNRDVSCPDMLMVIRSIIASKNGDTQTANEILAEL